MGKIVGHNLKLIGILHLVELPVPLRKKLKGLDGGRGIIKTELQKYLNEGLEEDEVWDDVLG